MKVVAALHEKPSERVMQRFRLSLAQTPAAGYTEVTAIEALSSDPAWAAFNEVLNQSCRDILRNEAFAKLLEDPGMVPALRDGVADEDEEHLQFQILMREAGRRLQRAAKIDELKAAQKEESTRYSNLRSFLGPLPSVTPEVTAEEQAEEDSADAALLLGGLSTATGTEATLVEWRVVCDTVDEVLREHSRGNGMVNTVAPDVALEVDWQYRHNWIASASLLSDFVMLLSVCFAPEVGWSPAGASPSVKEKLLAVLSLEIGVDLHSWPFMFWACAGAAVVFPLTMVHGVRLVFEGMLGRAETGAKAKLFSWRWNVRSVSEGVLRLGLLPNHKDTPRRLLVRLPV